MPTDFNATRLADVLQRHPDLQPLRSDAPNDRDNGIGNGVWVHTLAPDLRRDQVATVRFRQLPDRLRTLAHGDQLTIDVHTLHGAASFPPARLAIDQHFYGITVLFSPSTGYDGLNVLAIPGLGGHPYGSFVYKGDGHMWLSDSLPQDLPTARVMIYGYESGLQDSASFSGLDDLAGSLRLGIRRLLRSADQRLILVGHSLGGLLVKEALIQLAESGSEPDLIRRIFGAVFFGVPNSGMDIGSLIPMVNDQPNRFLLESLNMINSQVLRLQGRNFARLLGQTALDMFCFYETRLSPTATQVRSHTARITHTNREQDSAGRWRMNGPRRCLVSPDSATSCLPPDNSLGHSAELPRTHSELVKFALHDPEYEKISDVLCQMHQACFEASSNKTNSYPAAETDPQLTEQVKQCLQDLRLTDPRDDKKRIQEDKGGLIQDSFRWVLQNSQFKQWRHGPESHLLWIRGSPGKGKTMLLSGIVDELRKETQNATTPSPLIAFFFCQAADKELNNATAVLRGLLYLLIDQQPSLFSYVRKKYDHAGKALFEDKNAWVALSGVLAEMLQDEASKDAYLVIDALDECIDDRDRATLLKFLVQQSSVVGSRAKWIVSSRNWPQIEEQLHGAVQKVRLCLELNAESVSTAVNHFIHHKTNQLSNLKTYSDKTKNAIRDYLSSNADGTFLWVALVCKNLESVSRWNAEAHVKTCPPGLDDLYSRMMQHLSASDDAELCQHILAITSLARRPLALEELLPFISALEDVTEPLCDLEDVVRLCGSFLFLRSGQIFFVHQSARDFLAKAPAIFPSGVENVHYVIFSKSLEVLSQALQRDMYSLRSAGCLISDVEPPHPDPLAKARYSCTHWVDHLYASVVHNAARRNETLQDKSLVHSFLEKKYLYWLEALSLLGGMSDGVLAIEMLETLLVGINAHEDWSLPNMLGVGAHGDEVFDVTDPRRAPIHPLSQEYNREGSAAGVCFGTPLHPNR